MSLTRTVPAAVPLLRHSSSPCIAFVGRKEERAVDVGQVRWMRSCSAGEDVLDHDGAGGGAVALPQLMTVRRRRWPRKKSVPLTLVRKMGYEPRTAGVDVLDQTVPAAVPLLFQSSNPWVPSLAAKNSVPLTFVR